MSGYRADACPVILRSIRRTVLPIAAVGALVLAVGGCGANSSDLLNQAGSAVGYTLFDLFLTDVTNNLVDPFDPEEADDQEEAETDGDTDEGTDEDGDEGFDEDDGEQSSNVPPSNPVTEPTEEPDAGGGTAPAADAESGGIVYAERCTTCHGAGGVGGFAAELAGRELTTELEARYGGGATHGGTTLSEPEIADIAAYLASL